MNASQKLGILHTSWVFCFSSHEPSERNRGWALGFGVRVCRARFGEDVAHAPFAKGLRAFGHAEFGSQEAESQL